MPQAMDGTQIVWRHSLNRISWAFSFKSNLAKLTSSRKPRLSVKSTNIPQLCSLDLLRVVSTLWIIIIHSYSFALSWMKFDDTEAKRDLYKSLPTQFLANGTFSVDNFFLMSGFLTFMRHLNECRASRKAGPTDLWHRLRRFLSFTLRRYARLVPLMMIMIMSSVALLPRLSSGQDEAKWLIATQMFDQWCRSNWPINLMLAHNFFQTQQMCFSHSWYVAVDFQLFLLFKLLAFILNLNIHLFKPIAIVSVLIILLGQSISMIFTYVHDLPAIPLVPAKSQQSILDFYKYIYIKPFHWGSSYFIGILLAKIVLDIKIEGKVGANVQKLLRSASTVLILGLIFSNYFHFQRETPMSKEYASLYSLLARPIWSLCVACLIALSPTFRPAKFNSSSKMRLLSTLSRLSYSVYLLHPVQMATFYGNRAETFQFSHYLLLYFTIGNIVITYLGATFVYLFIELPIQNLLQINEDETISQANEVKPTGNRSTSRYELRPIELSDNEMRLQKRDEKKADSVGPSQCR